MGYETEVRKRLSEYLAKIGDALTEDEDIKRCDTLMSALRKLSEVTEEYYTPDEEGDYRPLEEKDRKAIGTAYDRALDQAYLLMGGDDGGMEPVRDMVRELNGIQIWFVSLFLLLRP